MEELTVLVPTNHIDKRSSLQYGGWLLRWYSMNVSDESWEDFSFRLMDGQYGEKNDVAANLRFARDIRGSYELITVSYKRDRRNYDRVRM
jgi:hypothetical protein